MIRVYARENATQRHGTATAVVGFFAARTIHESYVERQTEALRENLRLVSHSIGPQLASGPVDPASFQEQIKKAGTSPYRQIAHSALRELTGRNAEPTSEAWRRLLALQAPAKGSSSAL